MLVSGRVRSQSNFSQVTKNLPCLNGWVSLGFFFDTCFPPFQWKIQHYYNKTREVFETSTLLMLVFFFFFYLVAAWLWCWYFSGFFRWISILVVFTCFCQLLSYILLNSRHGWWAFHLRKLLDLDEVETSRRSPETCLRNKPFIFVYPPFKKTYIAPEILDHNPKWNNRLQKPSIFRGKLAFCFREGNIHQEIYIEIHLQMVDVLLIS